MQSLIRLGVLLTVTLTSLYGGSATADFDVTVTVSSSCSVGVSNLDFGTYDPTSATAKSGSTDITVNCTLLTPYDVNLSTGLSADYATRLMDGDSNASQQLQYNLYTDSGHSTIWGDGSGSTVNVSGVGLGLLTSNTHTVYGEIPIEQDVQPQVYRDTITVTVGY